MPPIPMPGLLMVPSHPSVRLAGPRWWLPTACLLLGRVGSLGPGPLPSLAHFLLVSCIFILFIYFYFWIWYFFLCEFSCEQSCLRRVVQCAGGQGVTQTTGHIHLPAPATLSTCVLRPGGPVRPCGRRRRGVARAGTSQWPAQASRWSTCDRARGLGTTCPTPSHALGFNLGLNPDLPSVQATAGDEPPGDARALALMGIHPWLRTSNHTTWCASIHPLPRSLQRGPVWAERRLPQTGLWC